jgi:hypothetical protein
MTQIVRAVWVCPMIGQGTTRNQTGPDLAKVMEFKKPLGWEWACRTGIGGGARIRLVEPTCTGLYSLA